MSKNFCLWCVVQFKNVILVSCVSCSFFFVLKKILNFFYHLFKHWRCISSTPCVHCIKTFLIFQFLLWIQRFFLIFFLFLGYGIYLSDHTEWSLLGHKKDDLRAEAGRITGYNVTNTGKSTESAHNYPKNRPTNQL